MSSVSSAQRFQEILNFLANVADSGYDTSTDEVLRRPDTVTVSTVHKVKGLEFPVVFLLGLEDGTAPTCGEVKERTERHLADVRAKIADLKQIEKVLSATAARCSM